ncbi:MAG: class I SAM-dependent methyltransferase [Phycisphaeraceae bacterium]|nr:class I SAM-dependent methyltransferase [Phycisphaeraceae bacterium]
MPTSHAFWDKVAEKHDRKTVKGPNYAARIERAATWIGPGASVLDVGCATGQITLDLAGRVGQVLGIDLSSKMIEIARARREELGVTNASFEVIAAEDPSLKPGTFDAITAYSLLHLVDDQPATLRRLCELLKPDGVLIVELPCKEDIRLHVRALVKVMTFIGKAPVVRLYSEAQNRAMFADAGFEVREVRIYNPKSKNRGVWAVRRG